MGTVSSLPSDAVRRELFRRGEEDALSGKPCRGKSQAYLSGFIYGKYLLEDKIYFHQKTRLE